MHGSRSASVGHPGTVLQYTPTNMGVKQEIILTRNVGKNEFPFLLETGGLNIVQQNQDFSQKHPPRRGFGLCGAFTPRGTVLQKMIYFPAPS